MFCGLITFILYVNLQLMKKLLRRMERINTLIEQQCTVLAVLAVVLVYNMNHFINFDSLNSSEVILENIPWHYHNRFFIAGFSVLFIAIFSYFAAFYEINMMFSINTLLSSICIIGLIVLSVTNEVTLSMISEKVDDKCLFVLPHFSQDFLMERGCEMKYTSFETNLQDMSCPKEQVTRIWEDNINLLAEDQKVVYGCLNQDCCSQVSNTITGRFNIVTVTLLVIVVYLLIFIVNMQYMFKVISRYNIRFLNHNGDHFNFGLIAVATLLFLYMRFFAKWEQMGPPVVDFTPIVPKKNEVFTYYDIKDPKIKKE